MSIDSDSIFADKVRGAAEPDSPVAQEAAGVLCGFTVRRRAAGRLNRHFLTKRGVDGNQPARYRNADATPKVTSVIRL